MRPPTIAIVLRGHSDKSGRQRLYLRYAWHYQTNYIVLPWRILAKDWDSNSQTVKSRATLGGETAVTVNGDLSKTLTKAYAIIAELTTSDIPPAFDEFRLRMGAGKKVTRHFADSARELLQRELDANEIAYRTFITYRAAVNKFEELMGKLRIQEISHDKVLDFKRKIVISGKDNMANQYIRYLKIVYGRVLKYFNLKDVRQAFDGVDIKVVKISDKKSLSREEYLTFRNALTKAKPGSKESETLRRFMIMCRGLRYSDTQRIKKSEHYFEMDGGDIVYRYLVIAAQKTGSAEIVPLPESDAELLLHWDAEGYLFPKQNYQTYRNRLRKLSLQLIGREITSHYGRHFTGDFILNSGEMGLEDVKKILGVKSDRIAEIYAQKDIKEVLRKFYLAMEGFEMKTQ